VREWCGRWVGLDTSATAPRLTARQRADRKRAELVARLMAPRPEPDLPAAAEVAAVLALGVPVTTSPQAAAWCESRKIDPRTVARLDLARFVPADAGALPAWATTAKGQSYPAAGWPLAVPMFDATGAARSIRWRALDGRSPKTLGSRSAGCVFANAAALEALRGTAAGLGGAVIVEGESDFLLAASRQPFGPNGAPVAVFGIVSGSLAREWTRKIPDGSLLVATDDDDQGDKYAAEVVELVGHRIRLGKLRAERWRAPERGQDLGDAGGLSTGHVEPIEAPAAAREDANG
jgi:hypothetical protein